MSDLNPPCQTCHHPYEDHITKGAATGGFYCRVKDCPCVVYVKQRPNPGSDAARTQGCICAVMDNNHGKFAPYPPDGWWISEGCPVHSAST